MPLPPEYHFSNTPILEEKLHLDFLEEQKWKEWGKTGFKLRQQIQKLALDYQTKLATGESPQQAILEWTWETAEDIEGFWFEYLCQHLVLPIKIEKKFIEDKWEIICPRYSDKPLSEIVLPEERNGAIKEGIDKLTEFLTVAPRNSTAILISPSGWSGLQTEEGKRIIYTETQIYIYQINIFGQIEAITLRCDNSLRQNKILYSVLSKNQLANLNNLHSDQSIIEETVRNPILIDGVESPSNFEDIIKILEQIKGSKYVLKERTFKELWEHFHKRQEISQLEEQTNFQADNEKARKIIQQFRKFMENFAYLSSNSLELIAKELENTLRRLYRLKTTPLSFLNLEQLVLTETQRQTELAGIQRLLGCTGTISSTSGILFAAFGPRSYYTQESFSQYRHCGRCNGKKGEFKEGEAICVNAIIIS